MLISFTFYAKRFYELSRICVLFCCLISRILKLKGILPTADESPCTKSCPINMHTFNASIGHSRKRVKPETSTSHSGSHFSTLSLDEKLNNIVTSVHELSTKMLELTSILHHHSTRWDMKFTSLQTQLDQIQRKLEEEYNERGSDSLIKKGEKII